MPKTRTLLVILLVLLSLSWVSSSSWLKKTKAIHIGSIPAPKPITVSSIEKMQVKASEAKRFVQRKHFNQELCFLLDMSLPSGQNRFFIYEFAKVMAAPPCRRIFSFALNPSLLPQGNLFCCGSMNS